MNEKTMNLKLTATEALTVLLAINKLSPNSSKKIRDATISVRNKMENTPLIFKN